MTEETTNKTPQDTELSEASLDGISGGKNIPVILPPAPPSKIGGTKPPEMS